LLTGDFSIYRLKTHVQNISKAVNCAELHYVFKHLFAGTQMLVKIKSVVSCQNSAEFNDQHW